MDEAAVQIVAPIGRDAHLLSQFLGESGIRTRIVSDSIGELTGEERDDAGALLIAEEALHPELISQLGQVLNEQPSWSDLPFLLMTASGRKGAEDTRKQTERLPLGNLTILERPVSPAALLSAVQAALRARRRQYEVRDASQRLNEIYAELRLSEQRGRLILESTHDCIKLLDLDANLLTMNEEGQKRLGVTDLGTVCGTSWLAFWRGSDVESARRAVASALAGGIGKFEGYYEIPSGEITWWDISVTPVRDENGAMIHLLAVSREITDRKLTEQALIQSEKLAAVGRLVSTISHEINNPLEAVANLIYIALTDERLHPEIESTLAAADDELRRASQIVGQTLRFHRQSSRPKRTTPDEMIGSLIGLYRGRLINSGIVTEVKHGTDAEFVCYDGEIRQVLSNLIGNAIDAMRGGGRLVIRTRRATDHRGAQSGVSISIADTGHGMEPAVLRRVFEAFFTTKGDQGTGLGLWITKGIIEKHQGSLKVRSRPGQGTVFRLFLPCEVSPKLEPLAASTRASS